MANRLHRSPGATLTRRGFNTGLATTVGAGLVLGTGVAPAVGQGRSDIRIALFGGDFGNLSPVVRYDSQGEMIVYQIMDRLVSINYETRKIEPLVAEAWSNPDPLTWRIKLREGIRWQKGYGEVTAEDLVYTWRYHLNSKSFQVGTALFPIDTVKADGKYVVEVKTKQPFGAFPGVTMGYGGFLVSAKAHSEMGNEAYSALPVGNGGYMIESKRGSEIILARNPDYWQKDRPKLNRLIFRAIPDSATRLQALAKREFDFITNPNPQQVGEVRKNSDLVVSSTPGWQWDFQQFNLAGMPDAPFQHKALRQAISYVIDREAIAKEIYYGEATPTDNQIPAGYMGYRDHILKYPKNGNLQKAKDLIAAAGLRGYEVDVLTSDKDWLRKELELIAAMVSQIGITYKIKNLDMGGFSNLWLNRKFAQVSEDVGLVAPDPDATSWWFLHTKGSATGYSNPDMDKLLDGARQELDQAKREKMYHQIVDLTLEECPIIYHLNSNLIRVYNKDLKGYNPTPQESVVKMDTVSWS